MILKRFSSAALTGSTLVYLILNALSGVAADDEVKPPAFSLGAPFVDHAVLQQGIELPVWGTAPAGTTVTVEFAGQTKSAVAGPDSRWRTRLDPLKADVMTSVNEKLEGKMLSVHADVGGNSETIEINDLLVGEVWLCVGQSNMAGPLKMGPWPPGTIRDANFPSLRQWRDEKWIVCTPETSKVFSRVAFCFAREIQSEIKVPIGLLMAATGGSSIEQWMATLPAQELVSERIWEGLQKPNRIRNFVTRIEPIAGYGIRGALWYQGEANDQEGPEYLTKMQMLIEGWRELWGQGDFPFYFVQIASIGSSEGVGPEMGDGRARIRNAQLEAMKIANTGMALTIDIGSVKEHPRNKYDVGLRLSRWAMRNQYGASDLVPSGPIYKSHVVEGSSIRVRFDYAESGLMLGVKEGYEPVKPIPGADIPWLSIQAKDGSWHWATGKLDGADLIVSSDQVKEPVAVRYAYTQYPTGFNLYNKEGLPASPFSTCGY
jgi:sialate O-acetylesterase